MNTSIPFNPAYEEIIKFIAGGVTPQSLIAFQPSEAVKERVADLIFREKNENLTPEKKSELDHYIVIEHLLKMAKAHAYESIKCNSQNAKTYLSNISF